MAKKRVHELAKDRGMDSAEVLAELQQAGHDVTTASSSLDEADAARELDRPVHFILFERDGEPMGGAYVPGDTQMAAYAHAADLDIAPGHTHAFVASSMGRWEADDRAPKEHHKRLLSPAELAEHEKAHAGRREARLEREAAAGFERRFPEPVGV